MIENPKDFIQKYFHDISRCSHSTVDLGLQLTTKCVNDCTYCGADRFNRNYTEVDFNLLISNINHYLDYAKSKGKALCVSLDGADNFQYTRFEDLVKFLKWNNISYSIKCNASTFTKVRAKLLKDTGCHMVRFTVLGNREYHNAHRGFDTFDKVLEKTQLAKEFNLQVGWNLTAGADNVNLFDEVIDIIPTLGLYSISENRMYKANMANTTEFRNMTPRDYKGFLGKLLDKWLEVGDEKFPLAFKDSLWVPFLASRRLLDITRLPQDKSIGCGLSGDYACIDVDGYVKGCITLESVAKETKTFENIIKFHPSKYTNIYFTKDTDFSSGSECEKCIFFNHCRGCLAVTLANTGKKTSQDPQCWIKLD